MKVAIFGAGAIGCYFGGRLAASEEAHVDVQLIARGAHLSALRSNGLRVTSANGDMALKLPATDDPAAVGPSDVVLFCVKSMDTEEAAKRMAPLLKAGTAVVTLQNGIDNEAKLAAIIGPEHVCGGVAYIMATISAPGVIAHTGTLARLVFGELDGRRSERLQALEKACRASAVDAVVSEDIAVELWRKFAMICAVAGMTAAVRLPMGDICASQESFRMLERIADEVTELARRENVDLPEDTASKIAAMAKTLPDDMYSSLYYDLVEGKPLELEALHGNAVRIAQKHGIEAKACEAVAAILAPWAQKARAAKKRS